ncbi:hypothetical protein SH1V18_02050 [Vallitalea longa]|uniref:SLH domain-containing protein n=1 Tax=Vallitalea longa TaxID=2936439 RepID=A0A9W5Y874_9FIRM|nr:S-layer homology domain-containing protein [Vallitalea longa]GKX27725.1 hypothetical protein SH1V18_02050 [Vallitalea longa]
MKRILSTIIILVLLSSNQIFAETTEVGEETIKGVHTEGIIDDGEKQAEMLKTLGLFKGTSNGFELDRGLKRVEAAVMLVRLLSEEEQALAGEWSHPFDDVPEWADPYVGWLYESGLTKGISGTKYGSSMDITFEQYALFLRRVQADDDQWTESIATEEEAKSFSENITFTRYTAVTLTTRFLTLTYYRNDNWTYNMARFFIEKGYFSVEELIRGSEGVISPTYVIEEDDKIHKRILDVDTLSSEIGNIKDTISTDNNVDYFYAKGFDEDKVYLYRIDKNTLDETLVLTRDANEYFSWDYEYGMSIDEVDYIFEIDREEKQSKLLAVREGEVSETISNLRENEFAFYPFENGNYFISQNVMVVEGKDGYYYIDNQEIRFHSLEVDTSILSFEGKCLITETINESMTKIMCIRADDADIIDSYSVSQDIPNEPYEGRSIKYVKDCEFYGEAGYYVLRDDRLMQITDRPALDIIHNDSSNEYIILTHEPGVRIHTMIGNGGNEIVSIDDKGNEKVLLSNEPKHGIDIFEFSDEATEEDILFESRTEVGMGHSDIFYYKLLPSQDIEDNYDEGQAQIVVVDYCAGRPEMEAEGYVKEYVDKKQKILDELGY